MTNYEKIKAMSIDEMTSLLYDYDLCVDCEIGYCCAVPCDECIKKWLESEVNENV